MKRLPKNGFTIFEVLLVMFICGLLIFSVTLAVSSYLRQARDAGRKADLEKIKIALYDYYFDNGCYPKTLPGCGGNLGFSDASYLNNFPCDPKGISYGYQIENEECSQWFKILTNLENLKDTGIDKVGCRNGCGPVCEYNYGLSSTNIRVNEGCIKYYACTPGSSSTSHCEEFVDPEASLCPAVFEDDPTCNNSCDKKENRCHDERGKQN